MSKDLQDFYNAYAQWLRDGSAIDDESYGLGSFRRVYGLCANLVRWCRKNGIDFDSDSDYHICDELTQQFVDAGLDRRTPFNSVLAGGRSYTAEVKSNSCHLNEARRQWVFDHANQ